MKLKHLLASLLLAFACGAPEDFDESETGALQQGMSAKVSATFAHGECFGGAHSKPQMNGGCPTGSILPSSFTVKYLLSGTVEPDPSNPWKQEVRRAFQNLAFDIAPSSWVFSEVTSAFDSPTAIFKVGDCPGDPASAQFITSFVCVSYDSGALGTGVFTPITSQIAGAWSRMNGTRVIVNIDMAAILARTTIIIDRHWILEHGTSYAAGLTIGMGSYPVTGNSSQLMTWSSPHIMHSNPLSANHYNFSSREKEEACVARSFSAANLNIFSVLAGVCTN